MTQRMDVGAFGDARGIDGALERLLQTAVGERMDRRTRLQTATRCGKHPRPRAVRFPEFTQQVERAVRQRHVPVLAALAMNMKKHPA